jgi:imidazolonepropionase-like amidohydrolase
MKQITIVLAAMCMCISAMCVSAFGQSTPTAYTNAHIIPVSGAVIDRGTVLVTNGKITAIGAHVIIPANAQRIDLHGATVIPGLVDASSSLFLTEETLTGAGTADQNVLDGMDPFDKAALKVLARGVTTVYISPGSRGGVGGLGAVVKLQNASSSSSPTGAGVFETTLKAKAGVHLALGLSTDGKSTSLDRIASYESIRSMFIGAQQYVKQQARAEEAKKAAAKPLPPVDDEEINAPGTDAQTDDEQGADESDADFAQRRQFGRGRGGARPGGAAAAPRAQPAQEVLAAALKGDIPVRIEAHRVDDILNALRLADEFKFKLVLEAPTEAGEAGLASEILARHVGVVCTPILPDGPPQLETAHYNPRSVATLGNAGVNLAISARSGTGVASRFLSEDAGAAAGSGLKPDAALKAITLGAAQLLGVADRVGSLQVGKDADLVILSGSPWDPQTVVKRVVVNGVQVYGAL